MATALRNKRRKSAAQTVRSRIDTGKPRLWKHSDFGDLPPSAVAATLSRLSRSGELERLSKGLYYRSVPTSFGASMASASSVAAARLTAPVHPAGLSAANTLGLTTQNPARPEYATPALARPTALRHARVHTRRPAQRAELSSDEGAILETLRERARSSDLSSDETVERLKTLLAHPGRYRHLARAALREPPRVRAMLGALGQELDMPPELLGQLRASLNPLSRFDFGQLRVARHAAEWQAK
jgi:Family of unknown function (DUF6088)